MITDVKGSPDPLVGNWSVFPILGDCSEALAISPPSVGLPREMTLEDDPKNCPKPLVPLVPLVPGLVEKLGLCGVPPYE